MREFLRHPLFWLHETLRWHWRKVVMEALFVWGVLMLALALLST